MGSDRLVERLTALLRPSVEMLGFELVGVEFAGTGAGVGTLRVYIDSEDGVVIDDCASVSRQVSGVLDVEDPIAGAYTLEVSSPGVFRPLFGAADFARFAGEPAKVELTLPLDGRKRFAGVLQGLDGEAVVLEQEGKRYELPLDLIAKANLNPEL